MAKITKKKFSSLSPSGIGKMKDPELRSLLLGVRNLYQAQSDVFKKYSESVFSPALDKMEEYYKNKGMKDISNMKRAEIQSELFRLQEFFQSRTSTVPESMRVQVEQDRRLFGVQTKDGISYTEKTGKPLARMGLEQRKSYWSAYNEFILTKGEAYLSRITSDVIQQYLGEIVLASTSSKDDPFEFSREFFKELELNLEKAKEEEWERSMYVHTDDDLYSGKRPY